ncbi:MAG: MFS transporter [Proteobacteria bacterium]|nr:MFS transporter [Pseudomonadota bacterium]
MTDRKLTSPSPIPEGAETAKGRWYIVGLLTLLYGLSFIDRMILALLAQPVALSLGLSDMQLGLLMGAGFAVVYSLAGLPIAHFVDRGNRKLIVTLGVLCWSVLTVASAFARDFSHLLVLRAGVAIGEAVLTPAAVSLIADMFPRKARAAPTAVYASMSSIMASGSFVIGAAALGLSTAIQHSTGLEPWRMTMVFVGAPGILVAAIFYFTTREPIRRMIGGVVVHASIGEGIAHLRKNWKLYAGFFLGAGINVSMAHALISWIPTILVRQQGMETAQAGLVAGMVGLTGGLTAATLWPLLTAWLDKRGRPEGVLISMTLACIVSGVSLVCIGLAPNVQLQIAAAYFGMTGVAAQGAIGTLVIQVFGVPALRARLTSVYLVFTSLLGQAAGPILVVFFSETQGSAVTALSYGVAMTGLVAGILSTLLYGFSALSARHAVVQET